MDTNQSIYAVSEIEVIKQPPLVVGEKIVHHIIIRIHGTDGDSIDISALTDHDGEPIRCNIVDGVEE